ncbi:protein-export chaperone SecB [Delftia acidovorans]|uniref:protein-export chaperone SecB n=1 Tax=Delftia acidovorans TaxID=80866 RepID=UPI00286F50E7|nr:protein-export chaperone SecB [Delftia acidovorans]
MTELHPIQLREITVSQLSIVVNDFNEAKHYEGEVDLVIKVGTSDFDEKDPFIAVGIEVNVSPRKSEPEASAAFEIKVELSGQFEVNYELFKFEHLNRWAQINAPFLLMPFVREQVYGLALRAGVKGVVFPLYTQPIRLPSN